MNNVSLIGRLCKDADVRTFGKGKDAVQMARFTLAVRDGKDKDGNERTQFISCTAWGAVVEIIEKYTQKGDMLAVDGKLVNNNYEKEDGQMVYQTEVRLNNVYLLPNTRNDSDAGKKSKSRR